MAELTITSVATDTKATVSDDKYNYDVAYSIGDSGKTLISVDIQVHDKDGKYIGVMAMSATSQSITAPSSTADMVSMSAMYNSVIAEIKSGLTA